MRRLLPDSIAGRILLALVVGLTLSHAISMAIYFGDRRDIVAVLGGSQVAERIATIARIVRKTPPQERRRLLEAATSPTLHIDWDKRSAIAQDDAGDWRARLTASALRLSLGAGGKRRIRVQYVDAPVAEGHFAAGPHFFVRGGRAAMMRDHMRRMQVDLDLGQMVRVSVELPDGTWLNFSAPRIRPASFWSVRFLLSFAVMILTIVLLSVWVVRRFTAPLDAFTRAAARLGRDVNAPPMPERGPREVRRGARSFNEMQGRIRRFLEDRMQMVAAISHDLRTPITRLRLRADLVEDDEQQSRMLRDLDEMETMIASVLSFAREDTEAEPQARLDLDALLQSICDDMTDAGKAVEIAGRPGLIYTGQRIALKRAFTNLIDNAVKYGTRARVRLIDDADRVTVEIDDDGPGIPEAEREKVFASFYRMDRSRSRDTGGAGLGLAFTRTIIRRHGGDITLHDRPEGGLRVRVALPR